jgi:hypothetical protein
LMALYSAAIFDITVKILVLIFGSLLIKKSLILIIKIAFYN